MLTRLLTVGSKRTLLVEAVATEAVATPSVRPWEYATGARAGTLVRRAHFGCDDFVDVLKCGTITENAEQLK